MKSVFRNGLINKYGIEENRRPGETDEQYDKRLLTSTFFVLKLTQVDCTPAKIMDGLFIGSIGCAYSPEILVGNGITHILCVAGSPKLKFPDMFTYRRISLVDDPIEIDRWNLVNVVIPECIEFLKNVLHLNENCIVSKDTTRSSEIMGRSDSTVLVHCYLGVSRAAFVCCAYLMYRHQAQKMTVFEALDIIRTVRPMVQPNTSFMLALRDYYQVLHDGTGDECSINTDNTGNISSDNDTGIAVVAPRSSASSVTVGIAADADGIDGAAESTTCTHSADTMSVPFFRA